MMSTSLRAVGAPGLKEAPPARSSLAERIRRLRAEARGLAREQVEALRATLLETQRLAEEIAQGGDAYPPGVREIAARVGEESLARALTLEAIMARC